MTCRNQSCRYEFCWLCMGPWLNHRACNQFNPNATNALDQDLEAYTHYNGRYMAHRNSLKLEENVSGLFKRSLFIQFQLNRKVDEKIGHLQEIYQYTDGQIKFLKNAVSTLAECRRTLMYSYSFAFFIRANHQKTIFEDNQKNLEHQTEELR